MKKHIYNAGPLFTKGEIAERLKEEELLKNLKEFTFYNPITAPCNDKSKLPTSLDIFMGDTEQILKSDVVIANLDHEDAGVMAELGIAWGLNFCAHMVEGLKDIGLLTKEAEHFLECSGIKKRDIYAVAYDLREATSNKYEGINVPFGRNQFVIGMIEDAGGKFVDSFEKAQEVLREE